jgi:murein DD-endopeptidase MepM/ murein hydrolase activator NlpD
MPLANGSRDISRHECHRPQACQGVIVKAPIAVVMLLSGALLGIPIVIGGNGSTSAAGCGELAVILDTIRSIESGGNYTAPKNAGGASGAYQYIDSTWNRYEGYESAYLAPPEVQDARAATDVQAVLATYGDVAFVPVIWYWPAAASNPAQLDIVPMPGAGNRLTVREYQRHWLAVYETKSASAVTGACVGVVSADGYALPIDRTLVAAKPTMLDEPHHDYPAIDLMIPTGSPVHAVRGGTVARVVEWPYNCWEVGRCEETCGIGLSIEGDDGARYVYCHGTRLNGVEVGDQVTVGQLLMWSGNTGRSGAPHLHLEIKVNGQQRCPQALLRALYDTGLGLTPASLGADDCSF